MFEHWGLLKPDLPRFKDKWKEYRAYMSQIPSNGALIYNTTMDKLLFIVYNNPRDRIVKKLDFPKGKVDQFETPEECAIREIYEETGLMLQDKLNPSHQVKVETIKNRGVTLFLIRGIEEKPLKPVKTKEVKEVAWIPI